MSFPAAPSPSWSTGCGSTRSSPPSCLSWNVAPGRDLYVVADTRSGVRRLGLMRWGLVPSWSTDPSSGPRPINARAESLLDRPAFADAVAHRRCLVPVDGFYEWRRLPSGGRQPWFIEPAPTGRWCWPGSGTAGSRRTASRHATVAIVTVAANEDVAGCTTACLRCWPIREQGPLARPPILDPDRLRPSSAPPTPGSSASAPSHPRSTTRPTTIPTCSTRGGGAGQPVLTLYREGTACKAVREDRRAERGEDDGGCSGRSRGVRSESGRGAGDARLALASCAGCLTLALGLVPTVAVPSAGSSDLGRHGRLEQHARDDRRLRGIDRVRDGGQGRCRSRRPSAMRSLTSVLDHHRRGAFDHPPAGPQHQADRGGGVQLHP